MGVMIQKSKAQDAMQPLYELLRKWVAAQDSDYLDTRLFKRVVNELCEAVEEAEKIINSV